MKALVLSCIAALALVGCEETTQVIGFNNHQTGQFQIVQDSCTTTKKCNNERLSDSRIVYAGNGISYFCDLNGFLYLIRKDGSSSESFKQENIRCSYTVYTL